MRLWQFILVFVALLATFDHIVNDSDGIREVADWLVRQRSSHRACDPRAGDVVLRRLAGKE
jgi:hypothetical protein